MDAQEVIKKLGLQPLPEEGGYYKETFRDTGRISSSTLPHLDGERVYSTCIYYLITPEEFSGLHGVKSTEIFHFYAGDTVEMVQIDASGRLKKIRLGSRLSEDELPQTIVPAHTWQGTKLLPGGKWALMGCTVAPGFEFADFLNGTAEELTKKFPQHEQTIRNYTHI
ncbi:MAG: hypothetical protein CL678_07170 [Bdellovibrionaceae bacterium]|nr:hypothetical protein [Pseudobdellovibrionaceae bacterium]|tara:strand:- start:1065 stop:1565 length:501 start_codon:yes stop_codon:yes gene_type:complete